MATSLYKMPFEAKRLKVQRIYESPLLTSCPEPPLTCEKIREIYGELRFPAVPADRPYTYTSLVTSLDGKIAFSDAPQGPLIARLNQKDPAGAMPIGLF